MRWANRIGFWLLMKSENIVLDLGLSVPEYKLGIIRLSSAQLDFIAPRVAYNNCRRFQCSDFGHNKNKSRGVASCSGF